MSRHQLRLGTPLTLTITLALAACSGGEATPRAETPSASPTAPAAKGSVPAARPTACTLVTKGEMEAIIGGSLTAVADDGSASTTCTYSPVTGMWPQAEFKIDWGNAAPAMLATGMLRRIEPGLTDPLAGLGDQAAQIGPSYWIRLGDDLVMLTFTGVDDAVAKAKRIVDIIKPRL